MGCSVNIWIYFFGSQSVGLDMFCLWFSDCISIRRKLQIWCGQCGKCTSYCVLVKDSISISFLFLWLVQGASVFKFSMFDFVMGFWEQNKKIHFNLIIQNKTGTHKLFFLFVSWASLLRRGSGKKMICKRHLHSKTLEQLKQLFFFKPNKVEYTLMSQNIMASHR